MAKAPARAEGDIAEQVEKVAAVGKSALAKYNIHSVPLVQWRDRLPQFSQGVNNKADFYAFGAFDQHDIAGIDQKLGFGQKLGRRFHPIAAFGVWAGRRAARASGDRRNGSASMVGNGRMIGNGGVQRRSSVGPSSSISPRMAMRRPIGDAAHAVDGLGHGQHIKRCGQSRRGWR